ncbi:MAG: cell surface protein SprA, partial [Flavobacteriaceae bacterium]|nr:cell surface protein SprA [Flavobacteriaceae bacterium]
ENNSIEFDLEKFLQIKMEVISKKIQSNEAIYFDEDMNLIDEFSQISQLPGQKKYKFSIKGNPSLGRIRTVLLGLKNPSQKIGDKLSGEVWFNELRISNIKTDGGWAAIGSLDANLADFANISLNGRLSSVGFGSIDKNPNERSNDSYKQFNFITNVNAGQLLPENWAINIPLSYTYSEELTKPKYDSFYNDIELNKVLDLSNNKDSIINQSQILSRSKSFSVLGLSKKKNSTKESRFYDIENLNFSYSYSENNFKDYELEYSDRKRIRANANYSFSFNDLSIYPFEKLISEDSKYLAWLKQFNFNPLPASLSFSGDFYRSLFVQKFREINYTGVSSNSQIPIPELRQRKYLFDWNMSVSHNLTNSIIINYNASNSNLVQNLGEDKSNIYNTDIGIFDNFFNVGEPNFFNQNITLNYQLPFDLIPFLNFIEGSYNYSGDFNWQRGSDILNNIISESGQILGRVNTIQNANNQSLSLSLNFDKIYRNISWLNKDDFIITELIKSLKRVRLNYSENSGKVLPGYIPSIGFLGTARPSIGFVFGSQSDIRYEAAKNGWLTDFQNFNQPFQKIFNSKFDFTGEIELLKSIRIDLNANRSYSNNFTENFNVTNQTYFSSNPNYYGNFSISSNMLKTSFKKRNKDFSFSFDKMKKNRIIIAQRLISQKSLNNIELDNDGFPVGFSKNNQEVLIPSFLSAYLGKNANDINLNPVSRNPKLNWSLQFDGLSKIFENLISRISISHSYRSNFTINNFRSNLNYELNSFDISGDYLSEKLYSNVNLVEQFNPLIELDIEFKNSLRLVLDVIRDRAISLSLANNFITESWGNEYIIGLGYRARNIRINSSLAPNSNSFAGDLNTKLDFSIRKNMTIIRNLNIQDNKVSAGQTLISAKLTADYALSRNFSAIFFYDHMFSKYEISSAFPQTNIRSGITLRYNFGN